MMNSENSHGPGEVTQALGTTVIRGTGMPMAGEAGIRICRVRGRIAAFC